MPCACRHEPVKKKLSIRHNSQLIYDAKKLVSPQRSRLRSNKEERIQVLHSSQLLGRLQSQHL